MRLGQVIQAAGIGENLGIWQGDELAAAGQLSILAGAGLLAGDGTVEAWRGKGLQQRLIRGRVRRAWELGVGWVHSEVAPDSGSYRNYERCGFVRAYSRVHYLKRF
jgi:GNAT superfamily N-acetyltransferase